MRLRPKRQRRIAASRPKNRGTLPTDWVNSLPDRPSRPRRLEGGRAVPVKNTTSAKNGRSKAITVRHAGESNAPRLGKFDGRSAAGQDHRKWVKEYTEHLGGSLSAPQRVLVDRLARLHVLVGLASDELSKAGAFKRGQPTAAFDAFRRVQADEERVLRLLGLKQVARNLPRLSDLLGDKS